MRICLFSDIHGNGFSFRAAYPMIMSEGADVHLFLGDLCGYYFNQKEIFDLLLSIPNLFAIRGNHDQFFLNISGGDEEFRKFYLNQYGPSMEYLLDEDAEELTRWIADLPEFNIWRDLNLFACHGSPWNYLEGYIYPDAVLDRFLEKPDSLYLLGHTHYRMVKKIGEKLIVNPGSLGQPRDGLLPSYAVIDYFPLHISFREVYYDKSALLRQIEERGVTNPCLTKHLLKNIA